MSQKDEIVLITGSTGMIGTRLKFLLKRNGYTVRELTRKSRKTSFNRFHWDVSSGYIDNDVLSGVDHIIHLSGASIGDRRWTDKRKQVLRDSRIKSITMLIDLIKEMNQPVKTLISASAIGYYGSRADEKLIEQSVPGTGFMAKLCVDWEAEAAKAGEYNVRTVINRIGLVIAFNKGVFKKFLASFNFGFAAYFGDGTQYFPWIHIDDLCNLIIRELEDHKMNGIYNAVAPEFLTNKELIRKIRKRVLKNAIWLRIPEAAIKLIFGEMGTALTQSTKVSADKLIQHGFSFKYPEFEEAIK